MKANVYSGFLTERVKVFPTEKGVAPFAISKRILQKASPFLLASAMVLSGCGRRSETSAFQQKNFLSEEKNKTELKAEWREVYDDVVKTYHLIGLQDKEPLPPEFVAELMEGKDTPFLSDTNFNHRVEDLDNFWEIIKNGVKVVNELQNSLNLEDAQKEEYRTTAVKMLSQISRVKGTKYEVDLSDYNNMKAFLYFEKVVKFGDDYCEVLETGDGWIDERAEILGRYYKDYLTLEQKAAHHPGIRKFASALYLNNDRFMISPKDSVRANALGQKFLNDWLEDRGVQNKGLWIFTNADEDIFANKIVYWHKRGKPVGIDLRIDATGNLGSGYFSPVGSIIVHELQHVMQYEPASNEKPEDNHVSEMKARDLPSKSFDVGHLSELGPTLYSLMLEDKIYKEIHGIDKNTVLNYGVVNVEGRKTQMGEIAVWFGKMLEKYPFKSVDKVLCQKEVLQQLNMWGNDNSLLMSRENTR